MEPLGIFSSAGTTADLCKKLLLLCKNVKNAATETDQLRQLVTNLQIVVKSVEEMCSSPNNAKLKHTRQLADAIRETQSLLQKLVDDLSPEKLHRIFRKIKGGSIKWPFEKEDFLKRMHDLERCMQIISDGLQVDQTNILLDIDYRAVFDRLPVASGAYFDSFDESRKARCLPNTRVDLLQDISNWAQNPDSHAVFWLNGIAGAGKSTISRTIADTFAHQNRLGASFFFKRGEADRGGLAKFFTTLATDLVQRQPAFAPLVKEAIDADSSIFTKSAADQFRGLIVGPLSNFPGGPDQIHPIVVVVDALDECDHDKDIELLIWLFSRFAQPAFIKLKFFLTSRPELPLRLGFKKIEGTYKDFILHKVPATTIESDISVFLQHELSNIRKNYNLLRPDSLKLPESWPGDNIIKILARMAVPLFIVASTTCRFIADHKHGDPQYQLQRILQYEAKITGSRLDATYLPVLNEQVDGLSHKEKAEVAEEFRTIVGTIIILANPLSIIALSHLVGISKEIIANRLETLHSVLNVSTSLHIPIRLLHLSFRDFLLDPETRDKTPLWIDEKQAHAKAAEHCLRLLDSLKSDTCDLKHPGIRSANIPRAKVDACLSKEIQYACLHWVEHVRQSEAKLVDGGQVSEFLFRHFLHWLEVLSLMGKARDIISLVKALQMCVEPEAGIKTSSFLNDAKRFAGTHITTIKSWPLQIYSCALIFTPADSIVRTRFKDSISSWISFPPLVEHSWGPCRQIFEGPSGDSVVCTDFSHDSTLVVSGYWDGTLRIWNVDTGECLQQMTGHRRSINWVEFSHDSSLLVSASSDMTVRIWHTETGDLINTLVGHSDSVTMAIFSHDSTLIASSSYDSTVRIWSVETGECKHELLGHEADVTSVAFSNDSTLVASTSFDGAVRIWSADGVERKSVLHQGKDEAYFAAFSVDSTHLVSFHKDGVLRFWRVDTDICERTIQLERWNMKPTHVALSHDWKYLLSAEKDTISLWQVDTAQCVQKFSGHVSYMSPAAFSHDSTSFASASRRGMIEVWAIAEQYQKQPVIDPATIDKHVSPVGEIIFSHDSSIVASTSMGDNTIMIWDATTGCCLRKLKCPEHLIEDMIFSQDGALVASVSGNLFPAKKKHARIWNSFTGRRVAKFSFPTQAKVAFSYDLKHIAISIGRVIHLWNVRKKVEVRTFEEDGDLHLVVFSHDSTVLGAVTTNGIISLWEVETGEPIYQNYIPDIKIERIALSHDLGLIAIASRSHDMRIICRDNGKCISKIKDLPETIASLKFTRNALFIGASTGRGDELFVWRIDTGQLIHNMRHWRMGQYLEFDINEQHDPIETTVEGQPSESSNTYHPCCGYDLDSDGRWITWGGHHLLRLPKKYETRTIAASDTAIVLGYDSGRVIIISTSTKDLPDFACITSNHLEERAA